MENGGFRDHAGALITCDPDSKSLVVAELRSVMSAQQKLQWLDEGVARLQTDSGFDEFADEIRRIAPVFVRHIAPVEYEVELAGTEADIPVLAGAMGDIAPRLDPASTFSVQSRILGEGKLPYRRVVLNEALSTRLESLSRARMDCKTPGQVVSLLCTPTRGFLGVSRTEQNRSAWPGGMHRFRDEEGQISRAEHKLLEAISVFNLVLPAQGTALDMGAAPGGWVRVLRGRGLQVVAVDPASLDPRVASDPGVVHVRRQIRDYLASSPDFDVITNDMRMDVGDSVAIMLEARRCLKAGGLAVMTLKLQKDPGSVTHALDTVRTALSRLAKSYAVLGARQLYHNRSEVTVALRAQ